MNSLKADIQTALEYEYDIEEDYDEGEMPTFVGKCYKLVGTTHSHIQDAEDSDSIRSFMERLTDDQLVMWHNTLEEEN